MASIASASSASAFPALDMSSPINYHEAAFTPLNFASTSSPAPLSATSPPAYWKTSVSISPLPPLSPTQFSPIRYSLQQEAGQCLAEPKEETNELPFDLGTTTSTVESLNARLVIAETSLYQSKKDNSSLTAALIGISSELTRMQECQRQFEKDKIISEAEATRMRKELARLEDSTPKLNKIHDMSLELLELSRNSRTLEASLTKVLDEEYARRNDVITLMHQNTQLQHSYNSMVQNVADMRLCHACHESGRMFLSSIAQHLPSQAYEMPTGNEEVLLRPRKRARKESPY